MVCIFSYRDRVSLLLALILLFNNYTLACLAWYYLGSKQRPKTLPCSPSKAISPSAIDRISSIASKLRCLRLCVDLFVFCDDSSTANESDIDSQLAKYQSINL